jgi:hypothetical protein
MSEGALRHTIAICAALLCFVCYYAGYVSGVQGWWFTGFGAIILYFVMLKIIDVLMTK